MDLLINYVHWFGHLFAQRIQIYIKVRFAGCCSTRMWAAVQFPNCQDRSGRLWKNECASQSRLPIRPGNFCIGNTLGTSERKKYIFTTPRVRKWPTHEY